MGIVHCPKRMKYSNLNCATDVRCTLLAAGNNTHYRMQLSCLLTQIKICGVEGTCKMDMWAGCTTEASIWSRLILWILSPPFADIGVWIIFLLRKYPLIWVCRASLIFDSTLLSLTWFRSSFSNLMLIFSCWFFLFWICCSSCFTSLFNVLYSLLNSS